MPLINNVKTHPSEWLKWEEGGSFSREDITILAGVDDPRVLLSGMVIAKTIAGKWVQLAPGGPDGSDVASAVLLFDSTAPNGVDKRAAAIARNAIVSDNGLKWPVGITAPQIATATEQLVARGIQVREGN